MWSCLRQPGACVGTDSECSQTRIPRGESMFRRKFVRLGAGLLMILALTLPVAGPVSAAVTSVTPLRGNDEGGYPATVNGSGFAAITAVNFCNTGTAVCNAAAVGTVTATTIAVTVPPAPAGNVLNTVGNTDVVVVGTGGGTCVGCFTYDEITITSVTPAGTGTA